MLNESWFIKIFWLFRFMNSIKLHQSKWSVLPEWYTSFHAKRFKFDEFPSCPKNDKCIKEMNACRNNPKNEEPPNHTININNLSDVLFKRLYTLTPNKNAHRCTIWIYWYILRFRRKMHKKNEMEKRKKLFTFSLFSSYACISTGDDGMLIHATTIMYFNLLVFLFWILLVFPAISSIRTPHCTVSVCLQNKKNYRKETNEQI